MIKIANGCRLTQGTRAATFACYLTALMLALSWSCPQRLVAQGVSAVPGRKQTRPRARASTSDRFARERKLLLGSGSSASSASETAVTIAKLLRSDESAAHALLREVLVAVPERVPVSTAQEIISALVRELGVDVDAGTRQDSRARYQRRLEFYRDYVRSLAELCARVPALLVPGPRSPFLRSLRAYFSRLPADLRRTALVALWQKSDDPAALAAVAIAGHSEAPSLAPELAKLLRDPALRAAARKALGSLTWRAQPFEDLQDFEEWWALHKGQSFAELTRSAAAAARDLGQQHRKQLAAERLRLRQKLLLRTRTLLRAMLAAPVPDWKEVGKLLEDPDLQGMRAELLDELALGLAQRDPSGVDIRSSLGELAVLRDSLGVAFEQAEQGERASVLAAWTLCAKWSGASASKEAVDRLLGYLDVPNGPVALPVLFELLRQFPEDRVRERVVAVLERPENAAAMSSGLVCIRALGASQHKAMLERSLALLENVVRDRKSSAEIRENALEVLGEFASSDLTALARLEALAILEEGSGLADSLRVTALQWAILQGRAIMQRLGNGELQVRTARELSFLRKCMDDKSARIRLESAKALAGFPEDGENFSKAQLQDFARSILGKVGEVLAHEDSLGCARQELDVLAQQAERSKLFPQAVGPLVHALVAWQSSEALRREVFTPLRAVAGQELTRLLQSPVLEAAVLLVHVEALGKLGLWREQAIVLGAPAFEALDQKLAVAQADAGNLQAIAKKRAGHVFHLAGLAKFELGGGLATGKTAQAILTPGDLARLITSSRHGFDLLIKDEPEAAVVLAEAMLTQKNSSAAASLLATWVAQNAGKADTELVKRARLVLARAQVLHGKPQLAVQTLAGDARPEARLVVAEAWAAAGQTKKALELFRQLVSAQVVLPAALVERTRNGLLAALLEESQLDEFQRFSKLWARPPEGIERDRRQLLQRRFTQSRKSGGRAGRPAPSKR